jgi:uncharacterized membrane protein YdcZ (DUF606 family)
MSAQTILAIFAALGTGTAIALQAMLNGRIGVSIGPVRAGLLINAIGGAMAILVVLGWLMLGQIGAAEADMMGLKNSSVQASRLVYLAVAAGLLGILVVTGVSFSVRTVGVTAGLAAVIVSQLVVGLLLDRMGVAGELAMVINARRVVGVVAMAIGVWLLIPRGG